MPKAVFFGEMSELTSRLKVTKAQLAVAFFLGCPHGILNLNKDFFTEWLSLFKLFAKARVVSFFAFIVCYAFYPRN